MNHNTTKKVLNGSEIEVANDNFVASLDAMTKEERDSVWNNLHENDYSTYLYVMLF